LTEQEDPTTLQQELDFHIALGSAYMVVKGWGAPEVERVYTRARTLCTQVGQTPQILRALNGLQAFHLVRADLHTARGLAEQFMSIAQRIQHPMALVWGHFMLGETRFYLGEFVAAQAHFAQGCTLYASQPRHPRPVWSMDPGMACLAWAAQTLWVLGYPDQALQHMQKALTLAQELPQPFSHAYALDMAAEFHQLRREGVLTHQYAEALMALSTTHDFAARKAQALYLRGWARAQQGHIAEGIGQLGQGRDAWQATGAAIGQPYQLALLGEAYLMARQVVAGLDAVAEALEIGQRRGECYWEAEIYRLKGELLLMGFADHQIDAEACFQQALLVARGQQAKSWELQAAMSLSRLWRQQGKRDEARALLAPIYGWFTEGFDTADLQDAKALLEALA
jgi:predicted ATPase